MSGALLDGMGTKAALRRRHLSRELKEGRELAICMWGSMLQAEGGIRKGPEVGVHLACSNKTREAAVAGDEQLSVSFTDCRILAM